MIYALHLNSSTSHDWRTRLGHRNYSVFEPTARWGVEGPAMWIIRLNSFHKYYPQLKAVFYPAGSLQFSHCI
jgi:hypothetical protein